MSLITVGAVLPRRQLLEPHWEDLTHSASFESFSQSEVAAAVQQATILHHSMQSSRPHFD